MAMAVPALGQRMETPLEIARVKVHLEVMALVATVQVATDPVALVLVAMDPVATVADLMAMDLSRGPGLPLLQPAVSSQQVLQLPRLGRALHRVSICHKSRCY